MMVDASYSISNWQSISYCVLSSHDLIVHCIVVRWSEATFRYCLKYRIVVCTATSHRKKQEYGIKCKMRLNQFQYSIEYCHLSIDY